MKHALTSINKPHTDNIFSEKKKIEWRKKPLPLGKHEIYETKNKGGCGKVVGTMNIVRNIKFKSVDHIPFEILNMGYVSTDYINEYANGGEIYGNVIENAQRYEKPKELSEFYVEGDCDCMNCKNCYWFDSGNGYNVEDDCNLAYKGIAEHKSFKPIKRPPQSWCYVYEVEK